MTERPCPSCASPVADDARYCVHCGAPQPDRVAAGSLAAAGPSLGVRPQEEGVPWRALDAFWVFLIHIVITGVIVGMFAVRFGGDTLTTIAILLSEIVLIATTFVWIGVRHGRGPAALGLRRVTPGNVGLGVALGLGGLFVAGIVSFAVISILESVQGTPVEQPEQIPLEGDPAREILVLLGISVVVLAPIAEEIFFRGLLFSGLRRWMRAWPAVLASSAIFAVTHIIPLVMAPIFALGILLAWVVERRRSIVPAIAAHMTFNGFGYWVMFVSDARIGF